MKVKQGDPRFKPIVLSITLESKEEVASFYALFNHAMVTRGLAIDQEALRHEISSQSGGSPDGYGEYHDMISANFTKD